MARIPIIQQQVMPQQGRSPGQASAADFGGDMGLGALAQGIGSVAGALTERQNRKDMFDVNRTAIEERLAVARDFEARANAAPLGADGFTDQLNADLEQRRQNLLEAKRAAGMSPDAVDALDLKLRDLQSGFQQRAIQFQAQSYGVKVVKEVDDATGALTQTASMLPSTYNDMVAEQAAMVDAIPNLDAVEKTKLKETGARQIRAAAGMGLAQQDPDYVISQLAGDGDYFSAIRQAESGGNDAAKNPASTATGRYQFIKQTWDGLVARYPEAGLTPDGRLDPAQQEIAIRLFTSENENTLGRAGIAITNGTRYAAHFLGAGGAVNVLTKPDADPISAHVGRDVLRANPFLDGMTVGDFKAWADRKASSPGRQAVDGKTGDPILDAMDASERQQVLSAAYTAKNRRTTDTRGQLELARKNAETAYLTTGEYDGPALSQQDFVRAYPDDPVRAELEFDQHQFVQQVGQQIAAMKTLPDAEIQERLDAIDPRNNTASPTFAADLQTFNVAQQAATAIREQRTKDPAQYVATNFPSVAEKAQAWAEAAPADQPAAAAAYLTAMDAAFDQLGVPPTQRGYLSAPMARQRVAEFMDVTQPLDARVNAIAGVILSTDNPVQQRAIFNQLVQADNSLAKFEAAVEAYARGEPAAARRLFEAGMVDPDRRGGVLPGGVKDADVKTLIADEVLAPGMIGDAFYGFRANVQGTAERARRDASLLEDAVKAGIRAGKSPEKALAQATRDVYGDFEVLETGNIVAALPTGTDRAAFAQGVGALRPRVKAAILGAFGELPPAATPEMQGPVAQERLRRDQMADIILDGGEWRRGSDGYVFIDTITGTPVAANGKPLTFQLPEILAAGAAELNTPLSGVGGEFGE
ncbi:lysozyme family protein [Pannonibacter tanglangensis]|uniref:Transglycosylase SLT domain-containing protein n=1 Tax=Pannonibacter tanglangensis TaxID=2750084 RepID=A0ABW9ZN08_9HYPH|nr:transglycosylase family protein [Pannonibacter sp. XCT-34]NBN64125.1 hypothetical protein [Pannonibacter sp. XCT-34]